MVLAMTHEEAVTDLARHFVQSYRQLPLMLFQVQMKFRDEPRPRAGLIRLREFLMKDAYSFHSDTESLDIFYDEMIAAYETFFQRCGVRALRVEADTGMMGGGVSHEFMVLSDGGEDTLLVCSHCGYAANREVAVAEKTRHDAKEVPFWQLYHGSEGQRIAVGIPQGRSVSEVKLARVLGIAETREVSPSEAGEAGFPVSGWFDGDLERDLKRCLDESNEISFVLDDTFVPGPETSATSKMYRTADVLAVGEEDKCFNCGEELAAMRGIEVGNIFKLGTYYSQSMQATYTDQGGASQPFVMGCYGIGITRMLASIIEDNHDEQGIVWPISVAPYRYHLVAIGNDDEVLQTAEELYRRLGSEQVLYDDRAATAGVKFHDADLLGLPYRLTVSRKSLSAGGIELRNRRSGDVRIIQAEDLADILATDL